MLSYDFNLRFQDYGNFTKILRGGQKHPNVTYFTEFSLHSVFILELLRR